MNLLKRIREKRRPKIHLSVVHSYKSSFYGKTIVVLGGAGGIGSTIAKELKTNGGNVVVCDINDPQIEGIGFCYCDLNDINNIEKVLNDIDKKHGLIHILINSQGICPNNDFKKAFFDITPNSFERVFVIKMESVFFSCHSICKYLINKNIQGRVLNIVSTEALRGGIVPYGLSKAALYSFTKGLGKEMAKHGIVVNGIAPGATATKMMKYTDDLSKGYLPTGRMCIPEEIARLAMFMLGDEGLQMPGQIVAIDGGESL